MPAPRIAVEPRELRPDLEEAVRSAGADVVEPANADGLVWVSFEKLDELGEILRDAPVRWVQLPTAGVERHFAAGLIDRHRIWTCGKDVFSGPCAEHALALTLAGMRRIHHWSRARAWEPPAGQNLIGSQIALFGAGGIAATFLRLIEPFECSVTVVRNRPAPIEGAESVLGFDSYHEALEAADVVVLALPLTGDTRGMLAAEEFELMKEHAWLVNVARGEHVVTDDLVTALERQQIGGAALDATSPEPLPTGHPLWDLENCVITPHVAINPTQSRPLLGARIAENVRRFADGRDLLGVVDADVGY